MRVKRGEADLFMQSHVLLISLIQGWSRYGLQARCGQQEALKWPVKELCKTCKFCPLITPNVTKITINTNIWSLCCLQRPYLLKYGSWCVSMITVLDIKFANRLEILKRWYHSLTIWHCLSLQTMKKDFWRSSAGPDWTAVELELEGQI